METPILKNGWLGAPGRWCDPQWWRKGKPRHRLKHRWPPIFPWEKAMEKAMGKKKNYGKTGHQSFLQKKQANDQDFRRFGLTVICTARSQHRFSCITSFLLVGAGFNPSKIAVVFCIPMVWSKKYEITNQVLILCVNFHQKTCGPPQKTNRTATKHY